MYPAKKPLRFVTIFVFLLAVFSEILHEILPFALFFVKKQLKKHDVPFKKTVTFCENIRFFACDFFWNTAWNLTFCPFFGQKYLKKHDVPFKKTVTFCENCRFFAGGNFWNTAWNLTFCPIFCQKTSKKTRCTLQKNRYVLIKLSFFCSR